jgi:FolB domain-containing protein
MPDLIRIVDLEVVAVIGVLEEERHQSQTLLFTLDLLIKDIGPAAYTDNVKLTLDYAAVAERVCLMAESRPRRLIETLAEDVATDLLKAFPILISLRLELKKFVLHNANYVSLVIERPMEGRPAISYRHSPTTSLRVGPNTSPRR